MNRICRSLLPLFLALAGCADGRSFVVVTVDGNLAVDHLLVSIASNGQRADPVTVPGPIPTTFALQFDANRRGPLDIDVKAYDDGAGKNQVAEVTGTATIVPSQVVTVTLHLAGPVPGDAEVLPDLVIPVEADMTIDGSMHDLVNLPHVTSVSPPSASTTGGGTITLHGDNFLAGVTVLFDKTPATSVNLISSNEIVAVAPKASAAGPIKLYVQNPDVPPVTANFAYYYGNVAFAAPSSIGSVSKPGGLATGHFYASTGADLAASSCMKVNNQYQLVVFKQGTGGKFSVGGTYSAAHCSTQVITADLNGDKLSDLLSVRTDDNSAGVRISQAGDLSQVADVKVGKQPVGVAAGRFKTADPVLDFVTANSGDQSFSLVTNPAALGYKESSVFTNLSATPSAIVSGDFNGNGRTDVVVALKESGQVLMYPGNNMGILDSPKSSPAGSVPSFLAVDDLRRSNVRDVVAASTTVVTPLLNNGDGTFTTGSSPMLMASPPITGIALGDLDGDRYPDLLVATATSVLFLHGVGDGTFMGGAPATPLGHPVAIVVADFNKDGKLDYATANSGSNDITVVFNTSTP